MKATRKVKLTSSLLVSCFMVAAVSLFVYPHSYAADNSTFPQLFTASCHHGGCLDYHPQCPTDIAYFTTTDNSITITAKNTNGQTCLAISACDKCRFLLGDNGITQITFDYEIADSCHDPQSQIAWLAFWLRSYNYSSNAEVDFIESKHGPAVNGLNTNFDAHGTQVMIFPAGQGRWTGSIKATFSGPSNAVSVSISNSTNSNIGTSTLTGGPTALTNGSGYYFLMDISPQGLTISPSCQITVSNLKLQGSVPSTLDGLPNCAGLQP